MNNRDRTSNLLTETLADVGHAANVLRASPRWTALIVTTLAVIAGSTAASFSLYWSAYFRSVDADAVERLVVIGTPSDTRDMMNISSGVIQALRARGRSFTAVEVASGQPVVTDEAHPERLNTVEITPGWLGAVRPRLSLGGGFVAADHAAGAAPVAIISHRLWQRRFGGAPDVIGKVIPLQDGRRVVVRGVMSPHFEAPLPAGRAMHLWVPSQDPLTDNFSEVDLIGVARLADGVSTKQAHAEMTKIVDGLKLQHPELDPTTSSTILMFSAAYMGGQQGPVLSMFQASQALLLAGIANISLFFLARTLRRRRDHAIRMALGAWPGRIVRQTLFEALLLSLVAAVMGVPLAYGWIWVTQRVFQDAWELNPGVRTAGFDLPTLAFTAAAAIATAVLISLPAMFEASRGEIHGTLKSSTRTHTGARSTNWTRDVLLGLQIAINVVFAMQAGIMGWVIVTTWRSLGFDAGDVVQMRIDFINPDLHRRQAEIKNDVLERLRAMPGMKSVAAMAPLPFASQFDRQIDTAHVTPPTTARVEPSKPARRIPVVWRVVGGDWMTTLRIPLRKGRGFEPGTLPKHPMVVDERFAEALSLGENPVGRQVWLDNSVVKGPWTIVGVVGDVLDQADHDPPATVYVPHELKRHDAGHILVRSSASLVTIRQQMSSALAASESRQPVAAVTRLRKFVLGQIENLVGETFAYSFFGTLALLLVLAGLYANTSALVVSRTNEIGLRMAVGASPAAITRWVRRHSLRPVVWGILGGTALLLASGWPGSPVRLMGNVRSNVGWTTYIAWVALSVVTTTLAVFVAVHIPAKRASRMAPMDALRHE